MLVEEIGQGTLRVDGAKVDGTMVDGAKVKGAVRPVVAATAIANIAVRIASNTPAVDLISEDAGPVKIGLVLAVAEALVR